MTIKAVAIDDEVNNLNNLDSILKKHCPEIEIIATANTVKSAIEVLKKHKPDLLFLDIQLHNETGFDLLEKLAQINFEVIFVTAYDKYALKAIKFCALDYLLKPININELKIAVARAQKKLSSNSKQLEYLIENLSTPKSINKRIALPTADKLVFVHVNEIIQCIGENNYTNFVLTNGNKLLVSRTLKEYEELLSDYNFMRVHQSHLINLSYVKTYVKSDGGYIVMSDDSIASISRQKKEEVLKRLSG